jgi:hypothetical protein
MINCKLHLFTAVIHCFSKLLVTPHVLSIHLANCQLHLEHHYYIPHSNLQHLNMFRNDSTRATLRLTLGLGKTSTPHFVDHQKVWWLSILTILMHRPYNYMPLLHFCKVSSKSVIVKVLLQFGHFVDIIRNVTCPLYQPCFWHKRLSFTQFLIQIESTKNTTHTYRLWSIRS